MGKILGTIAKTIGGSVLALGAGLATTATIGKIEEYHDKRSDRKLKEEVEDVIRNTYALGDEMRIKIWKALMRHLYFDIDKFDLAECRDIDSCELADIARKMWVASKMLKKKEDEERKLRQDFDRIGIDSESDQ